MIFISDTDLEDTLKSLLQKHVKLWLNNKVWREGRLLLFKQSGFYLELLLKSKKKPRERFEIPIPFGLESWLDDNIVYFDYQLSSLAGSKNTDLIKKLVSIKQTSKNKFYNSILEIEIVPDEIR